MKAFPGNRYKALTFSFDDGVFNDIRFSLLLKKYGMKATFNINSGKMTSMDQWIYKDTIVKHLTYEEMVIAYEGHEIASHSLTHPFPDRMNEKEYQNEVFLDIHNIESLFNRHVVGFAYPYGTVTETGLKVLKNNGIKYARAVGETFNFDIPNDLLSYKGTCHFKNSNLFDLANEFINLKTQEKKVFFIWGHTYEFVCEDDWDRFEKFLKLMKEHEDDIYFGTNQEVLLHE